MTATATHNNAVTHLELSFGARPVRGVRAVPLLARQPLNQHPDDPSRPTQRDTYIAGTGRTRGEDQLHPSLLPFLALFRRTVRRVGMGAQALRMLVPKRSVCTHATRAARRHLGALVKVADGPRRCLRRGSRWSLAALVLQRRMRTTPSSSLALSKA